MPKIETFIEKIENFGQLSSSNQIDFFAYFLLFEKNFDGVITKDIIQCFDELHLVPYSNIPSYLSSKTKGKGKKFIKKNGGKYY